MSSRTCNHITENGSYCRSAALKGRNYCYFHVRLRARQLAMEQAKSQKLPWRLNLPPLEDMPAVQSALMQVMEALAAGCIDERRASLLLYGLQQAATNLKSAAGWLGSRFQSELGSDWHALSYPRLEAEFGLPKRLDIDTPPQVAFPARPALPGNVLATGEVPKRPPAGVKNQEDVGDTCYFKLPPR
jgi:hypothetical protein